MRLSDDVKSITWLKNNAAGLVEEVSSTRRAVAITQHGEPKVVVLDVRTFDEWQEALAMIALAEQARADMEAARTSTSSAVFQKARARVRRRAAR